MDQPPKQLGSEQLKQLWKQFEGSPFEFWDLAYAQTSSNRSEAEPLLARGGCKSFVDRILAAAGHPPQR